MAENRTLARPYAKAVFRLAQESGLFAEWADVLNVLALIVQDKRVQKLIKDQTIPKPKKAQWIISLKENLFKERASNFIMLLAEQERLLLLPEIFELFSVYRRQAEAVVDVVVSTATPLTKPQQEVLQGVLEKRFMQKILMTCNVDEKLMGGVVIRSGGRVIDGSTVGRLSELRETLVS